MLLRGRQSKTSGQVPVNLTRVLSSLVQLSDRLLRRQSAAPAAAADEQPTVVSVESSNCNYFHNQLVSLTTSCLIELCIFINNKTKNSVKKRSKRQA